MKSLLGKLSPRRALGVYVDEHEITVSQVSSTILGPVEIYRHSAPCEPHEFANVLERILQPLVSKRPSKRRLIAFGLPLLRVFLTTRPLKATNVEVSPKVLLHEVLQSPNSNVDEMAIDLVQGSPGKRPVVSLASCRRKYLAGLLAGMQDCGVRPMRVEPVPCALLRAAEQQYRAPRKAKTVLRLFLGADEGLAVLSVSSWPLVPRAFPITAGDMTPAVVSIVRTLDTLGKLCGTDAAIDALVIHGAPDMRDRVDPVALEQQIAVSTKWMDGPPFDSGSIAFGLALGCLSSSSKAFDLARSMKPRESLWNIFPWKETAVQLVVLACLGFFLMNHSQDLTLKYMSVRSETDGRHWIASMSDQQLAKEKQELEQRVEAVRRFLATRVVWTEYTHNIPTQLPALAKLNSLQGVCELEKKAKKDGNVIKPKKSLTMRIGAPIAGDGATPKEVDQCLDALRDNALLKRDFPLVELADIKWYQPFMGAQPTAYFTVVCLPKPTGPAGAPAAGDDKSHK